MKNLLSKLCVFALAVVTAFTFVSCGEKELEKEEAFNALETAVENVLTDVKQIGITVSATAVVTNDETAESSSEATIEAGTYTFSAGGAVVTDDERKVQSASLNVYLSNGEENALTLELYVKDGYQYTYTNLFGESYGYDEVDENEPLKISEEDMAEIKEAIGKFKENFPAPKATQKDGKITFVWNVTNENKLEYAKAISAISGEEFNEEEIKPTLDAIDIEKGELTLVVDDGKITTLTINVKGSGEGAKIDATAQITIAYSNVAPQFDATRLQEIKDGYEAGRSGN